MQRNIIRQVTPAEIFELSWQEVEKSLNTDIIEKINIYRQEHDDNFPPVIARCLITNQAAHLVYYPGANVEGAENDIPLHTIINMVDRQLDFIGDKKLAIKKYFTVGVFNKIAIDKNHYVAIVDIHDKLTVINPGRNEIAHYSNPDMKYLASHIGNLSSLPRAANIQKMFDRSSSGYLVAAIHGSSAREQNKDFDAVISDINLEFAIRHYKSKTQLHKKNEVNDNFFRAHPVLTGIMAGLIMVFFLAGLAGILVCTYGTAGIFVGSVITFASAYIGTQFCSGVIASLLGASIIGIGLATVATIIGGGIGAMAGWITGCFNQSSSKKELTTNGEEKPHVCLSSQSEIRNCMCLTNAKKSRKDGDKDYNEKKYAEALVKYKQATKLRPDYAKAYLYCGDVYYQTGKYIEAILYYNEALRLKKTAVGYKNRGDAYYFIGDYEAAITSYSRAIDLDPKHIKAFERREDAHKKLGEPRAMEDYRRDSMTVGYK